MKTIPSGFASRLSSENHRVVVCWLVEKSTGQIIRGTSHDRDIEVTVESATGLNGVYRSQANITSTKLKSGSDLSVDNMDVDGAVEDSQQYDITVEEIEAGVLDRAPTQVFVCDWSAPDDGQVIVRRGFLGEINRDSDGKYTTEIRGLSQLLQQSFGRSYGERCNVVRFGDARCGFNVATVTLAPLPVASVTDRRHLVLTYAPDLPLAFAVGGGVITFTSGDNNGFSREVKRVMQVGSTLEVELWDETAADAAVADTVSLQAGCDRRYTTCRDVYSNVVNFRGWGAFIPGILKMMAGPAPVEDCVIPLPTDEDSPT